MAVYCIQILILWQLTPSSVTALYCLCTVGEGQERNHYINKQKKKIPILWAHINSVKYMPAFSMYLNMCRSYLWIRSYPEISPWFLKLLFLILLIFEKEPFSVKDKICCFIFEKKWSVGKFEKKIQYSQKLCS